MLPILSKREKIPTSCVLVSLLQPERDVKSDNKEYDKRNLFGIDSGKLIMNFY